MTQRYAKQPALLALRGCDETVLSGKRWMGALRLEPLGLDLPEQGG